MRLHTIRIHITPCAPGMLSIGVMHVVYEHGRIVGNDLMYNDWCEADELSGVVDPFLMTACEYSNDLPGGLANSRADTTPGAMLLHTRAPAAVRRNPTHPAPED